MTFIEDKINIDKLGMKIQKLEQDLVRAKAQGLQDLYNRNIHYGTIVKPVIYDSTISGTTTDDSTTTYSGSVTFNEGVATLNSPKIADDTIKTSGDASITVPNTTDTLVATNTTDTLTNKSLTSPTLTDDQIITSGANTVSVPDATDTMVIRDATETLNNKTLSTTAGGGTVYSSGDDLYALGNTPNIYLRDTGNVTATIETYLQMQDSASSTVLRLSAVSGHIYLENLATNYNLTLGTTGTGYIIISSSGAMQPLFDNTTSLGTSNKEFKDLYIDGTAYLDTLGLTNSGTVTVSNIYDTDAMTEDSATALATQQSIKAYIDKANMIGSGNATWIPCTFEHEGNSVRTAIVSYGRVLNISTTGCVYSFHIPLPTNRGGLKLYIKDIKLVLSDADANNYVDRLRVFGNDNSGNTSIYDDGTNRTAAGDYTYSNAAADDVSGYDRVTIYLDCATDTAYALDIPAVNIQCYYDS